MRRNALVAVAAIVLGGVLLYTLRPAPSNLMVGRPPNQFTVGTAIVVVGYVVFPALLLMAVVLLLVALMLFAAHLIERRRAARRATSRGPAQRWASRRAMMDPAKREADPWPTT